MTADRLRPSLKKSLVIFLSLGPAIGGVTVFVQAAFFWVGRDELIADSTMLFTLSGIGLTLAYVFGAIPALVTGVAYWFLRRSQRPLHGLLAVTAIGALVSPLCVHLTLATNFPPAEFEVARWQYYVLPGAIAALISAFTSNAGMSGKSA
jgi:hypothetical protein